MAFLHKLQAYIFVWERLNFVQIISLIFNSLQMHQIVDQNKQKRFFRGGSVCGSVGRAVASNTRGPSFESSHRQIFVYFQL